MNRSENLPEIEDDEPNLPCEIIEAILVGLPVKSLLRFKSVSKSWYSLISDSIFAKRHLDQSKKSGETLFLVPPISDTRLKFRLLRFENQALRSEATLEFPVEKYRKAVLLCACDGLVLLRNHKPSSDRRYVLWNPSNRTYAKFSCPYMIPLHHCAAHGLCYDPWNDDYKVVIVILGDLYVVFSYKNRYWTESLTMPIRTVGRGLPVNGFLHWAGMELGTTSQDEEFAGENVASHNDVNDPVNQRHHPFRFEIFRFDPRDDKFGRLSKPECFEESHLFELTSLRGNLCLYWNSYDMTTIEIWMMKEYGNGDSWMNFMTIDNVPFVSRWTDNVKPLSLTSKDEVVLWTDDPGFVVYDPRVKKFGNFQCYYKKRRMMAMFYFPMCYHPSSLLDSLFFPIRESQKSLDKAN